MAPRATSRRSSLHEPRYIPNLRRYWSLLCSHAVTHGLRLEGNLTITDDYLFIIKFFIRINSISYGKECPRPLPSPQTPPRRPCNALVTPPPLEPQCRCRPVFISITKLFSAAEGRLG